MVEKARSDGQATRFKVLFFFLIILTIFKLLMHVYRFGTVFDSGVSLSNKKLGIGVMNGFLGVQSFNFVQSPPLKSKNYQRT